MTVPAPVLHAPLKSSVNLDIGSGFTYSRSSPATVMNGGVLVTKGSNLARFTDTPAFLNEGSDTNEALFNRDWTDAVWGVTNITPLKNAVGLDGVINSASSLEATSANGTIFQIVTKSSIENTFSVDVRRKSGGGLIQITDNGGSSYTSISINSSTYTRFEITSTQANPEFGIRIAISGDEIEVDYAQLEEKDFASSRIEVPAGTPITRAADQLSYNASNWPTLNAPFSVAVTARSFSPNASMIVWRISGLADSTRLETNGAGFYRFRYGGQTATDNAAEANTGSSRETSTWNSATSHILYRDGSQEDIDGSPATTTGTVVEIRMGRSSASSANWYGEIADFKIWDVELTSDQVLEEALPSGSLTGPLTSSLTSSLTSNLTG